MPWDDDNHNDKGPWGQAPGGKKPQDNNPQSSRQQPDDIDEIIRKSQEKIRDIFGGGGNRGGGGKGGGRATPPINSNKLIGVIIAIVGLFWIGSGVYTVNTKEVGVVLRFGEFVGTTNPGINYHLPFPIERVIKLKVTDRYRTQIGNNSTGGTEQRFANLKDNRNSRKEILMLTGDENLVSVEFVEVQWQIENPEKFLFNVYDPEITVRDAAESAIREVVGKTRLSEILSEGREKLQLDTEELLQSMLSSYDIGITVEDVNISAVPPKTTIEVMNKSINEKGEIIDKAIITTIDEAFKDVQAAKANKEAAINAAQARENEIVPIARGRAEKLIQEAQGYKEQIIAKAEGEAKRFVSVYDEYRKAKDVTRKRIYLETMEEVLKGMNKIVLDSKGGVVPYLPLNELNKKR
ncbi:MAG: HflK protein [Alphaproteobacteria bacterium CG11_big_fil_rev_8_21_14_0_20_39_49]|nr:MAG: HflK protein [Alphaproteobacteria bacterium CG11_big_fil_rev_8_21_14_0_20_39_49]